METSVNNKVLELLSFYDKNDLLPDDWELAYIHRDDLKLFKYTYIDPWLCYGYEYNWESKKMDRYDRVCEINKLREEGLVTIRKGQYLLWKDGIPVTL